MNVPSEAKEEEELSPTRNGEKNQESSDEAETILRVQDLTKSFDGRTVVNQVSFQVSRGEIVGLLGRNGAGKTTSFKMTIGLLKPERGSVFLAEEDVTNLPMYRRARRGMGYLAQEPSLLGKLTVEENLRAVLEGRGCGETDMEEKISRLLSEFEVDHLGDQKAGTLSGGESRRVEICRAIATEPDVILLDEPFSGVDPIAVSDLQDLVLSLRDRSIGIFLTDHNVRKTLQVTDRSYIIDEGRILADGPAEEIVENEVVRRVYLGEDFSL